MQGPTLRRHCRRLRHKAEEDRLRQSCWALVRPHHCSTSRLHLRFSKVHQIVLCRHILQRTIEVQCVPLDSQLDNDLLRAAFMYDVCVYTYIECACVYICAVCIVGTSAGAPASVCASSGRLALVSIAQPPPVPVVVCWYQADVSVGDSSRCCGSAEVIFFLQNCRRTQTQTQTQTQTHYNQNPQWDSSGTTLGEMQNTYT